MPDYIPDYYQKSILILGCGNTLFGDDGFGPAAVNYLDKHYKTPAHVAILDVGTSVREILFNVILAEKKPQRIIIVDALDCHREPGEIFIASIEDIPERKIHDFSVHQTPTINLLKELRDGCELDILIVAVQPEFIPEEVRPGLSDKVQAAIAPVCDYITRNCF